MALSIYKTFIPLETIFSADFNALQLHFVNNALTLISPLTGDLDFNGNAAIMDADGDLSIDESADDILAIKVGSTELVKFNLATASAVNGLTVTAGASGSPVTVAAHGSDSDVNILLDPKGSGVVDLDNATLTLDTDADSTIRMTADDVFALRLQAFDSLIVDGDVASPVNGVKITTTATGVAAIIAAQGEANASLNLDHAGGTGEVLVEGAEVFDYNYAATSANQAITAATETDITTLTAITLHNTAATLVNRRFWVQFHVTMADTSGAANAAVIKVYNGANGTKADTQVYQAGDTLTASTLATTISGGFLLTPTGSGSTKVGLSVTTGGNAQVNGASTGASTILITEKKV